MLGSSRQSLAAVREAVAGGTDLLAVSVELMNVVEVLGAANGSARALRGRLADGGSDRDARLSLLREVFGGSVGPSALGVLEVIVGLRWSTPRDLVDAVQWAALEAGLVEAAHQQATDQVQDELFKFARAIDGSADLRAVLDDTRVDGGSKRALVGELLAGTHDLTRAIACGQIANLRGRTAIEALDEAVTRAGERRERLVADVRVATAMSPDQITRLEAALGAVYGQAVQAQVSVDPEVLGGVRVQIGNEVIDGTLRRRIAEARAAMGA